MPPADVSTNSFLGSSHRAVSRRSDAGALWRRCISWTARAALLGAAQAQAQPAPVLEVVEVIGRRDTAALAVAASRFDVLAADEQVSLNRTPGDWLALMPGVSLNGQGGLLQSYSVRGFSRARIRTEFDGVPILTDRRAGTSVSFVPPELLEQIVVDKAAASTLYGSGAMGGVVSLLPVEIKGTRLTVDGRSNDGQVAITALAGDSERLGVGVSARRADNAQAADGSALYTQFEQLAGLLRGTLRGDDLDLRYSWLPSLGRDIGRSNAEYPDRRVAIAPQDDHSIARVELRSSGRWLLRAYHHFQDWSTDTLRVGDRRNLTSYRAHTVGGLWHASFDGLGGEAAWGIEWLGRRGVDIDETEFDASGEVVVDQTVLEGEEDTLGAFLEQRWRLGETDLRGGLRLDHLRQAADAGRREDERWSASLRADRRLGQVWQLGAEVASAYRFPTLSERYFNGVTPRGEVVGNPDLRPETRRSAELSLRLEDPARPLAATLAAFYSDLGDYIERFPVAPDVLSYRNIDDAQLYGWEAALEYRWGALAHTLTYQWQDGEGDDGRTLADLNPPELRYALAWNGGVFQLRSDLSYRSSRSEAGPGEQPLDDATLWNLRATLPFAASEWSTQVYVNNVLDETYRASADELAPLQPGRMIGLRVEWRAG